MPLPLGACNCGTAETVNPALSMVAPPEWTNTPSMLLPSSVAVLLKAFSVPLLKLTQVSGFGWAAKMLVISTSPPPPMVIVPKLSALFAFAKFNW